VPTSYNPYQATSTRRRLPPPEPLTGRKPRILASVPRYLPDHNAGAEATLHALLRWLVADGWDAVVASVEHRGPDYEWDGVKVVGSPRDLDRQSLWEWCDVGVTHLHGSRSAMGWASRGRPLVHLVHNHSQLDRERVRQGGAQLVVFNATWVAEQYAGRLLWPAAVVHPWVDPADYRTENPDRQLCGAATLLNLTEVKGGQTFWRLVAERPDLPFLGVEGAYYLQEVPSRMPANARVVENQVDVRDIYEQTRVLLIPSRYESWGRVAVEAMASGIPIIASPTPGLQEACTSPELGACAIFADPDDLDAWKDALAALDVPSVYEDWSQRSAARGAELEALGRAQMTELASKLYALAEGRSLA
jgi:glycosyltransferase involved in cell wall biosynthesis